MFKKGSITVFFCLMLAVFLVFVFGFIKSAKLSCARAQAANALDQSLFNLFSMYDRDLLDDYELYYLDGGFGQGEIQQGLIYGNVTEDARDVLMPGKGLLPGSNLTGLSLGEGSITCYRLASDMNGAIFRRQAVEYMKDTMVEQGIQSLMQKAQSDKEKIEALQSDKLDNESMWDEYEDEKNMIEEAAKADENEEGSTPDENVPDSASDMVKPDESTPDSVYDGEAMDGALDTIKAMMGWGVIKLAVPDANNVSGRGADIDTFLSKRELQSGMGLVEAYDDGDEGKFLFSRFVLDKLGNYREPTLIDGLNYQTEYVLEGEDSDRENLSGVVGKILLIREAANLAYIYADPAMSSEASAAAMAIASAVALPPLEMIIKPIIVLCWGFGESVLDVREIMDGGAVPLLKSPETWQLSLSELPHLLGGMDSLRKKSNTGMKYEDYLGALLLAEDIDVMTLRCMDMVEHTVRVKHGRSSFRLDSCLSYLEFQLEVLMDKREKLKVTRNFSYQMQ